MSTHDVRLLVGDTDATDYVLQDSDIAFFLSESDEDIYMAAVMAAESIAAKYARMVTNSQSDAHGVHALTRHYSDRHKHYLDLAKRLERRKSGNALRKMSGGGVYAGGISQSDKDTRADNDDRPAPAFSRSLHDNPGKVDTDGRFLE